MAKTPAAADRKPAARRRGRETHVAASAGAPAFEPPPEPPASATVAPPSADAIVAPPTADANPAAPLEAAAAKAAADEPVPYDAETLKRIKDIIGNARATWFALLGALVFAAITLASVKDVAFFVDTVETQLPIVGFSVPVRSFFWAGALLIAALYAYFHLYLELLWQALGDAPARVAYKPADGGPMRTAPLADYIEPWIVADAALRRRDKLRGVENDDARAARQRMMPWVGYLVFFGLVWLFGLVVIGWFWWRSMPAHEPLLTGWLALVFAFTLWVYFKSRHSARDHLRNTKTKEKWRIWFPVVFATIAGLTVVRTSSDPWAGKPRQTIFQYQVKEKRFEARFDFLRPARAVLYETIFSEKPADWKGMDFAEKEFRLKWCKEHWDNKEKDCGKSLDADIHGLFNDQEGTEFAAAWKLHKRALIDSFKKVDLRRKDLQGAIFFLSELEGVDFSDANLDGASFWGAKLDGAIFFRTSINGADFSEVVARHADFRDIEGDGGNFTGANFSYSNFNKIIFSNSVFDDTSFSNAFGSQILLLDSVVKYTDFGSSQIDKIIIAGKTISDTKTHCAYFLNARLKFIGIRNFRLENCMLPAVNNYYGDSTVELPEGAARSEIWCDEPISTEEFFLRWLGWMEVHGVELPTETKDRSIAIDAPCPAIKPIED